jgi:hypothetical protein
MSFDFCKYTFEFMDNEYREYQNVTRQFIDSGVVHLFRKNGALAPEEHVVSVPLHNVRAWNKKSER